MVVLLHRRRTARLVPAANLYISYTQDILASVYDRFTKGFCRCGHVCRCSLYVIALVGGIERTKLQIGARPDKRRNARAGSDTVHGGPARPNNPDCHELSGVRHGYPDLWRGSSTYVRRTR